MVLPEFVPSDAVTVRSPAALTGTVNAQLLKLPFASVVQGAEVVAPLPTEFERTLAALRQYRPVSK